MTNEEKNRLSAVLRATEYLFLENIALKLVQERAAVLLCPGKIAWLRRALVNPRQKSMSGGGSLDDRKV
jgi:hypothetical protein